jgi:hypothetical protein
MFTILGGGFGLYGYLPAILRLEPRVILPARYRPVVERRPELQGCIPRIDWTDDLRSLAGATAAVIALPPAWQAEALARCLAFPDIRRLVQVMLSSPAPAAQADRSRACHSRSGKRSASVPAAFPGRGTRLERSAWCWAQTCCSMKAGASLEGALCPEPVDLIVQRAERRIRRAKRH